MHRLICTFIVRIWLKQVFSWHGSPGSTLSNQILCIIMIGLKILPGPFHLFIVLLLFYMNMNLKTMSMKSLTKSRTSPKDSLNFPFFHGLQFRSTREPSIVTYILKASFCNIVLLKSQQLEKWQVHKDKNILIYIKWFYSGISGYCFSTDGYTFPHICLSWSTPGLTEPYLSYIWATWVTYEPRHKKTCFCHMRTKNPEHACSLPR